MTENTTPDDAAAETPAESEQTAAAASASTGPTEPIAPEVPVAAAPAVSAAPVAPAAPVAATPAQPTAPTAPIVPAAAQPAAAQPASPPVAPAAAQQAPAAAHQHTGPTDAFGQPVVPNATVYAPNAAPQAYAQAPGHPTQPTQPYAAAPGTGAGAPSATKRRGTLPIVAALIAGALIGGVSSAGVAAIVANNDDTTQTASTTTPQNVVVNDATSVNEITAVAAKASPSVVTISVSAAGSGGTGSGIVLSKDGYVLTNTHVVTLDGSASDVTIQVETSDGKLYAAKLIGTDPVSDLAVIKLTDASDLTPLEFADSSKLNVGDAAIAIGAPLGLSGTVTNGIVSALNRSIQVASSAAPDSSGDTQTPSTPDGQDGGQGFDFWNFDMPGQEQQQTTQPTSTISLPVIQTDAAINPGNSGGALLNSKGELIGVNVAIASAGATAEGSQSGSIGVGFAIPANLAKRVADEIINDGKASHGMLGASVQDATSSDAGVVGALVQEVVSGGAAADAGLKAGDIVTNFNGVPISNATDLTAQVRYLPAGEKAKVTYTRDGKSATVTVELGEYSAN